MTRWQRLAPVVLLLLVAAALRITSLGSIPPGFSQAELETLSITERFQMGQIVVLGQTQNGSMETMFPIVQATAASLLGEGLLTLRLPAVWCGLLTLALLYALTRRLHGDRAALLATGLMAVSFWPVLLARLSLREVLVPFFTLATLLAFSNAFHLRQRVSPDTPTTTGYTILGFVIAGSFYVHWFGYFLALIVTLAVIYLFVTRQAISRYAARASGFAMLVTLIVIIPYVATTLRLPDANSLTALSAAMRPPSVLQSIVDGLSALFARGDLNPAANLPGRPLLDPLTALLFLAGVIHGLRFWRRPAAFIPVLAVLVALLPALLSTEPGSFLALIGALPLIFLLAGVAGDHALRWLAARRTPLARYTPLLGVLLVVGNLAWTGNDLFNIWPRQPDVMIVYHASRGLLARYLEQTARQIPSVVCSPGLVDTAGMPGDPHLFELMLHQDDAPIRFVDCANGLVIDEGGQPQQIAFTDLALLSRMQPALRVWLDDQPTTAVPGLPARSVFRLDVQQRVEDTVGRLLTTSPTGFAPESPGGAGPVTLPARFGGNITFLGYEIDSEQAYQGSDVIQVVSYWRVDGRVPPDLRIFVHLLSDPAAIVTQSSAMNTWTASLHNRDIFIQVNYLTLPQNIPPGSYDISIGAYQADSGQRLAVFDGERERGNRLFLHQITVEEES